MWRLPFTLILAAVACVSVANPEPTLLQREFDADGWTPAPTAPAQLVRRHDSNDLTCAYVNGDASASLTCSTGMCGYDFTSSWFGCCNSTTLISGTAEPYKCPIVTDCVDYTDLPQCTSAADCASNPAISKCTDTASPYCATYALLDFQSMYHYLCRETSFTSEAYLAPTETANSTEAALTTDGSAESAAVPSAQGTSIESTTSETTAAEAISSSTISKSTTLSSLASGTADSRGLLWLAKNVGAAAIVIIVLA